MPKRIIIAGGGGGIDKVFSLRHPKTGSCCRKLCIVLKWNGAGGSSMYSVSKDKQLLELQRVDGADYSWFLDDNVVSGGSKLPLFVVSNAALQMAPSLCVHLSILFSWRFISSRKRGTRSGAALIDPPRLELITIHAD